MADPATGEPMRRPFPLTPCREKCLVDSPAARPGCEPWMVFVMAWAERVQAIPAFGAELLAEPDLAHLVSIVALFRNEADKAPALAALASSSMLLGLFGKG